ncbi:MAG: hypothetical protein Q9219_006539 [cf. Caloplaca sp. 3 TL-2023]
MSPPEDAASSLSIIMVGTCDTKLHEISYLRFKILSHPGDSSITLIDVGREPGSDPAISIPRDEVLKRYGSLDPAKLPSLYRSQVLQIMTECATACLRDLLSTIPVHGVISLGGSGDTSLTSTAMRCALPFLIPKLISTVVSGDTAPFIGEADMTLMYSIVDIAGSNNILDSVLDNAAGGIVGMARAYPKRQIMSRRPRTADPAATLQPNRAGKTRIRIGMTMFGVTTPYSMSSKSTSSTPPATVASQWKRLVSTHGLDAIIDIITTEIADHIVGGVMSAGPHRLEAAAEAGLPQIISLGACDIVNFGPRHTLPREMDEAKRNVYEHNSSITLAARTRKIASTSVAS